MLKNHPSGLIPASLSNMVECFGFYFMNAVLLLFLCSKFGLSEDTATAIYVVFYTFFYLIAIAGGAFADRLGNYKTTVAGGLIVMALGYGMLAYPTLADASSHKGLFVFTCCALLVVALGNGLFKGNLQAIVGQMYDRFEDDAASKGPEALKAVQGKRDSGFQIFYIFINIGGLAAPFLAPYLRGWWLEINSLHYSAKLPALCQQYLAEASQMGDEAVANLRALATDANGGSLGNLHDFCQYYLDTFNTGVHYSLIASVFAMLISLLMFATFQNNFPEIEKKVKVALSLEARKALAEKVKRRINALYCLLAVAVVFWLSFHLLGQSPSVLVSDLVGPENKAPSEIWQAANPFFVIVLTPLAIWLVSMLRKRGKNVPTTRKIAWGMGIAAIVYLFLAVFSIIKGHPSHTELNDMDIAVREELQAGQWVLIVTYLLLSLAEVFIVPIGMSFASRIAPVRHQGLCQGLWLATTALGSLCVWLAPLLYNSWPLWACWAVLLAVALISTTVMFAMVHWLERIAQE